jgi:hypothetical protein
MRDADTLSSDTKRVLDEIARWLVDVGYPFDWSAPGHPVPEALRPPLAEAWHAHDAIDESVEDYYATLAEEAGWDAGGMTRFSDIAWDGPAAVVQAMQRQAAHDEPEPNEPEPQPQPHHDDARDDAIARQKALLKPWGRRRQ